MIDAFNRDKPYDEFLREQIAGDILAAQRPAGEVRRRAIVATGYLAIARRFGHDIDKDMHLTHEDAIDTLGKALLGLTIGCARCHDHKYDPITAERLLRPLRHPRQHEVRVPRLRAEAAAARPRAARCRRPSGTARQAVPATSSRPLDADSSSVATTAKRGADGCRPRARRPTGPGAQGEIADGGEQGVRRRRPRSTVKAGEMLLLSVSPLKNHGADTTLVEIGDPEDGGREAPVEPDAPTCSTTSSPATRTPTGHGNAGVWWFLDGRNRPTLLPEAVRDLSGKPGLHAWRNGDTPSVVRQRRARSRSPSGRSCRRGRCSSTRRPNGAVAVGWLSPIDGKVRVTGRVEGRPPRRPGRRRLDARARSRPTSRRPRARLADAAEKHRRLRPRSGPSSSAGRPRRTWPTPSPRATPADARLHLRGDPEKLGDGRAAPLAGGARRPRRSPARPAAAGCELAGWLDATRTTR